MNNSNRIKPKAANKANLPVVRKTTKKESGKAPILTQEAYRSTMTAIDTLMKKGESNLTPHEVETLSTLAAAAELYEDIHKWKVKS